MSSLNCQEKATGKAKTAHDAHTIDPNKNMEWLREKDTNPQTLGGLEV